MSKNTRVRDPERTGRSPLGVFPHRGDAVASEDVPPTEAEEVEEEEKTDGFTPSSATSTSGDSQEGSEEDEDEDEG